MASSQTSPIPAGRTDTVLVDRAQQISRASWGAIFAGAICGLAIYLILGLIGLAAGIGFIDPAEEAQPLAGVPTGVGIWWAFSAFAAFFCSGLIAGRLAGWRKDVTGALHGMTVGALTVLLVAYVATSAIGSTVTGAAGAVASLFNDPQNKQILIATRGSSQQQGRGSDTRPSEGADISRAQLLNAIERLGNQQDGSSGSTGAGSFVTNYLLVEAMQAIRREGAALLERFVSDREAERVRSAVQATFADIIETPSDVRSEVRELFQTLLSNDGVLGPEDREQAKRILVERLGLEVGQADRILERWKERYEEAVGNLETLVNDAQSDVTKWLETTQNRVASTAEKAQEDFRDVVSVKEQQQAQRIVSRTFDDIVASPGDAPTDLNNMFDKLFSKDGVWSEEDLKELRAVLAKRTELSEQDINEIASRWQARYQTAVAESQKAIEAIQQRALELSDAALDRTAAIAGWTSLALVLAIAASTLGGLVGRPPDSDPTVAREVETDPSGDFESSNGGTSPIPAAMAESTSSGVDDDGDVQLSKGLSAAATAEDETPGSSDDEGETVSATGEPLNHGKPWSDTDLEILRELAPTKTAAQIARRLKRTEVAVQTKASDEDIELGS